MKKSFRAWCVLALVLGVAAAAQMDFRLPPETARLKPGEGSELATAQCLTCHSADYVATQPRLSRAGWQATVRKMREKYGAPIPTEKDSVLIDYLVKNYGAESPSKPNASPPKRSD